MRILIPLALALAMTGISSGTQTALLTVDDGNFFYDQNGDCKGDTDTSRTAVALHHWHYAAPFAGVAHEVQGGFGCLGGPRTWQITVPPGETARIEGRIRYTWDIHVFPGGGNDVHLLVEAADGSIVHSTLVEQGPAPAAGSFTSLVVSPIAALVRPIDVTLGEGTYRLTEDVTSGAHTSWVTRLSVNLQ